MTIEQLKDIAAIIAAVVAIASLAKAVLEYVAQGAQKRAEFFFGLERRFWDNPQFKEICDGLEHERTELTDIPFKDKLQFLNFYEAIALALNSKLISVDVAHYMFGYYATRCLDSKRFWEGVDFESPYWGLFKDFAHRMKSVELRLQG